MTHLISQLCPVGIIGSAGTTRAIWSGLFSSPLPEINIAYIQTGNRTGGVWRTASGYTVSHNQVNLLSAYGHILLDVANQTYMSDSANVLSCPPSKRIPYDLVWALSSLAQPNACIHTCSAGHSCVPYWGESKICQQRGINVILYPILAAIILVFAGMVRFSHYLVSAPRAPTSCSQLEQLIDEPE